LSPSPGSGSPSQALQTTTTTNAQGKEVSTGQLVRMAPIYQELQVPGQAQQSFNLLDAFVPVSGQSQIQTLSGFMIAGSDPGHYGQLKMFVTPRNSPVNGPSIVAAQIDATPKVSHRSRCSTRMARRVVLGNVLMIPVANSLLYVNRCTSSRRAILSRVATGDRRVRNPSGHRLHPGGGAHPGVQAPVSTTPGRGSTTGTLSSPGPVTAGRRPRPPTSSP
jgi:hypothetical protein